MVNKKGIIRIIEASIAVLIIFGVLLVLAVNRARVVEQDLSEDLPPLLDEIAKNSTLRGKIVGINEDIEGNLDPSGVGLVESEIENFLSDKIRKPFRYKVRVCSTGDVCGLEQYPTGASIFAAERIVSSTLRIYGPKKVKIFVWLER